MRRGVAITGMGIVSAIGTSAEENFHALVNGTDGLTAIDNIETIHRDSIRAGEIKRTTMQLAEDLRLAPDHTFSRTAMLGAIAARQAVAHSAIGAINARHTGLISATTVGGVDLTEKYYRRYFEDPDCLKYVSSHDVGNVAHKIADELGLRGFVTTVSTACSSAANAIMFGARLIQSGKLERAIVGGTDALTKFTINGFKTLMILSDAKSMPFDNDRKGLNLGEAAAYLVLESDAVVEEDGKTVLARVSGYGNANDAFHLTASSENGDGAYRAMMKALTTAAARPEDIDYINVHGTATPNNDLSEGRAMLRVFGEHRVPDFSSTKPFSGHALGAAAAIEAVYSILALQHGVVFPNLNFTTPMEEFDLIPQTSVKRKPIRHVMSNSFGFGGNCSTLIFSQSE